MIGMVLAQITIGTMTISPEAAAIISSIIVATGSMYIGFTKWLPGFMDRREALWEKARESELQNEQAKRDEDAAQRQAISELIQAQTNVQKGTMTFMEQLLAVNAKNAATEIATERSIAASARANEATAKAMTGLTEELFENTEASKQLSQNFARLLNEGSEPLRNQGKQIDRVFEDPEVSLPIISRKLDNMLTVILEIKNDLTNCFEAKKVIQDNPSIGVNVDQLERETTIVQATLKMGIEDEKKHASKPIPPVVLPPDAPQASGF